MAQPTALLSKIYLSEDEFKKFMRKTAAKAVAEQVFLILNNDLQNYLVFKFLKKESCLYAFLYFNYGNRQFLLEHPLLEMLQNTLPHLNDQSNSYIIATRDSLNCVQEDFVYSKIIKNQTWEDHIFTQKELNVIWKDSQKHFFKFAEIPFKLAFNKKSILDKSILTRVTKLQEEYRVNFVKYNLHIASLEKPVEIFTGYFYNGKYFYTSNFKNSVTVFEDINLQEIVQKPYGVCDNTHVIVGDVIIKADSKSFKMHQREETVYYSSKEGVYNEKMELYDNSDGKSFSLKYGALGEDKDHYYLCNNQLSKQETGICKINTSGYFNKNAVIYSDKQVRTARVIYDEIDAETFEILSDSPSLKASLPNSSGVYGDVFILHCKDKKGELVLYNFDIYVNEVKMERIDNIENYLKKADHELQKITEEKAKKDLPNFDKIKNDVMASFAAMNQYMSDWDDSKAENWKYNDYFLRCINNYLFNCWTLYSAAKEKSYLEKGIEIFEKIQQYAFLNPYIFHHTACFYTILGDKEKAMTSISSAFYYGYNQIDKIWEDQDLSPILSSPEIIEFKDFYWDNKNFYPFLNLYILERWEDMTDEYSKKIFSTNMLSEFNIYNFENLSQITDKDLLEYYIELQQKTEEFLNFALQHTSSLSDYSYYKENPMLHIDTHFHALKIAFSRTHSSYPSDVMSTCIDIANKIKEMLSQQKNISKEIVEKIQNNDLNKIFEIITY